MAFEAKTGFCPSAFLPTSQVQAQSALPKVTRDECQILHISRSSQMPVRRCGYSHTQSYAFKVACNIPATAVL